MYIEYKVNVSVSSDQFVTLLKESSLADRRPVDDWECIERMLANSNLIVSAWDKAKLIGIARSVTDFSYACYLSDLAVSEIYQKKGIGKALQQYTRGQLGPKCTLILIAAPAAANYYGHIGFERNERCWILQPGKPIA